MVVLQKCNYITGPSHMKEGHGWNRTKQIKIKEHQNNIIFVQLMNLFNCWNLLYIKKNNNCIFKLEAI